MQIKEAFTYMFREKNFVQSFLICVLMLGITTLLGYFTEKQSAGSPISTFVYLVSLLISLLFNGFVIKAIQNTGFREIIPDWNDEFLNIFKLGAKSFVATLIPMITILIFCFICGLLFIPIASSSPTATTNLMILAITFASIIAFGYLFLSFGFMIYFVDTESIMAFLRFDKAFVIVKSTLSQCVIAGLVTLLPFILLCIPFIILFAILGKQFIIAGILLYALFSTYMAFVWIHMMCQIYQDYKNKQII